MWNDLFPGTELHKAVMEGDTEQARRLLQDGADVRSRGRGHDERGLHRCRPARGRHGRLGGERPAARSLTTQQTGEDGRD